MKLAKTAKIAAITLLLLALLTPLTVTQAQQEEGKITAYVQHYMKMDRSGLLLINDTVSLVTEEKQATIQEIFVGVPRNLKEKLSHITAKPLTKPSIELSVEKAELWEENFYGAKITFKQPLPLLPRQRYIILVSYTLTDVVTPHPKETSQFNITFPIIPALSLQAYLCNSTLELPPGARVLPGASHSTNTTWTERAVYVKYLKENVEPFSGERAWMQIATPRIQPIECPFMQRKIILSQYGRLEIHDTYHIVYKGNGRLTNLTVPLPPHAQSVRARGSLGELTAKQQEGNEAVISLEVSVDPGQTTVFTVLYELPWSEYVESRGGSYTLKLCPNAGVRWEIEDFAVEVVLPKGAKIRVVEPEPSLKKSTGFSYTIEIDYVEETPINPLQLSLSYEYSPIWAPLYPTLWTALLAFIVYAAARTIRPPPPVPAVPIPVDTIRSFLNLYKRRDSIMRELTAIEEEARKGRMPRSRYRSRRRRLEAELARISKSMEPLKEELRRAGGRIADAIAMIEIAEAELQEAESGMRRLTIRYRRREISSDAYKRLLRDYRKRIDKAKTTIDEGLLRLREELGA
ncbi:MAG TPA: hypothetical protein ENF62_00055 [Candidatus Bathyarchaeota archaeon]|nr:hypothetical protein [Candidatus Bathyarchaeota archaeon]